MTDRRPSRTGFSGDGEMARRMREHDWAASPFGDAASWSPALRSTIALMLDSRFPMFVAWGDGLRFFYNDAYAAILGDKHPAALGARFDEIWAEIWGDISPLIDRALAGEATWIENLPLRLNRHGHNEQTWFTFSYSPARDADGTVAGLFCVCTDTTEQVLAEHGLRDLNQILESRVEERTAKLIEAEEHLRQTQKLEAIGQLTGGVAHDFNNLLTVIRGSVDLLRRPGLPEAKRDRYLDAIATTADQAAALTAQLLAFARRQALKPELFDACRALSGMADLLRATLGSGVDLDMRVEPGACHMFVDRAQFETVIVNMAINARDAMSGAGSLTITASPTSGVPALRSHPPVAGDFIAVTIADTGRGIARGELDRVFEPFFSTKGVGEGSGLGLSQALGFAKQSGGDIAVHSVEGEGASFTLYLPRAPARESTDRHDEAESGDAADDLCILVVEDNAQVGEFASQALRELGHDSTLAGDAAAALAELEKDRARFHVVFSDVVMPGMNGVELGREINRRYPDVPVILASGYSNVLARQADHGFPLLHKPYSVDQLSGVLREVVGRRAAARTG